MSCQDFGGREYQGVKGTGRFISDILEGNRVVAKWDEKQESWMETGSFRSQDA